MVRALFVGFEGVAAAQHVIRVIVAIGGVQVSEIVDELLQRVYLRPAFLKLGFLVRQGVRELRFLLRSGLFVDTRGAERTEDDACFSRGRCDGFQGGLGNHHRAFQLEAVIGRKRGEALAVKARNEHAAKQRRFLPQEFERLVGVRFELRQVVLGGLRIADASVLEGARHDGDVLRHGRHALRVKKAELPGDGFALRREPAMRFLAKRPRSAGPLRQIEAVGVLGLPG